MLEGKHVKVPRLNGVCYFIVQRLHNLTSTSRYMSRYINIIVIGPSAERVTGSLLRPLNILYALKSLKKIKVTYIPVKSIVHLIMKLRLLLSSGILIASGVNPWVSALISLLGRVTNKIVIVDVHGFAWYEALVTRYGNPLYRIILFISEFIAYRTSTYLIVASEWLAKVLSEYFRVKINEKIYILSNTTSIIFETVVNRLRTYNTDLLQRLILSKILSCEIHINEITKRKKFIFIAPLPNTFKSNVIAHDMLMKLINKLPKNIMIVITGHVSKSKRYLDKIVYAGYLTYPEYVALILVSDGMMVPYPTIAICGGIRNKVLEAGYSGKLVISTKTGMMHMHALPGIHYLSFKDYMKVLEHGSIMNWNNIAHRLREKVLSQYSSIMFIKHFLKILYDLVKLSIRGHAK